jgi:hypothetical protein
MPAFWSWQAQDRTGTILGEYSDLQSRSLAFHLNRPATASATLRIDSPAASTGLLQPGVTELRAVRDGSPVGTIFRLSRISIDDTGSGTTVVNCEWDGIMSYLADLLALQGANYTATAQSSIAWGWINTAQSRASANYGITRGAIPSSDPTKSVKIEDDTELLESIISLSERANGFDFDVDTDRSFNVYHPQQGSSNGLVFDSDYNVAGYSVALDAGPGSISTWVRVRGGEGAARSAQNATAATLYGRREASIQYSGVIADTTVLQAYADRLVADRAEPIAVPALQLVVDHSSIPFGSYWLGDTVRVRIRAGELLTIDRDYRIVSIQIELDAADNETITVEVNAV